VLEEMPRPITPLQVAAYTLWAPLLVTACVFLARFFGVYVGFLLPLAIVPALVFGPLHAVDAAERMAVTRALREGGIRSGRQDRTYIFSWTAILAAVELLTGAAGALALLLTK
jgi:hypothetical protein